MAAGVSLATLYAWRALPKEGSDRGELPRSLVTTNAQSVRDVFLLRALTGLHHSEVGRIASGAKVRRVDGGTAGEIRGVVEVRHKSGHLHRVSLGAQALAAVERLQAVGVAPDRKTVAVAMNEAADRAGLPHMRPTELRHSFATLSEQGGRVVYPSGSGGVARGLIANALGHSSPRTTVRFYLDVQVPPMIVPPLTLSNVEDPSEPGASSNLQAGAHEVTQDGTHPVPLKVSDRAVV